MLSIGQVTATSTAATLCHVPGGPCLVTITNDSLSATTAYIATATASTAYTFTSSNGIPVPAGQSLVFANYPGSGGATLSVITASTTATVGFLISGASGGTGL
jgi:hypothetical protein